MPQLRGTAHPRAELIATEVLSIRAEYTPGVVSYRDLAQAYGVSSTTISDIVNRRTWKHL